MEQSIGGEGMLIGVAMEEKQRDGVTEACVEF